MHAIQEYATATKAGFMPHLERAMKLVEEMANHIHEAAREMAYQAMPALLAAVADAYPSHTPGGCDCSATMHLHEWHLPSTGLSAR